LLAAVASAAFVVTLVPASALAVPAVATAAGGVTPALRGMSDEASATLLATVITRSEGMSTITVTDPQYDQYFAGDNAVAGVKAILAAGRYAINGFAIPATESDLDADYPDGYTVDGAPWLHETDGTWYGGNGGTTAADSYAEAAFDTGTAIPAGLEIRLLDTDGDGYADEISADYKEGLIADKITHNSDGTYSIVRSALDSRYSSEKVYDGEHFTSTSGEVIPAANFDTSIRAGDVVLFWYGPDGWAVQRAVEAKGTFVDGADHEYYQIDGTTYEDAMRFSRDNIIISNRPGEFTDAQKYFGLIDDSRHPVSLWLVPTSTEGVYGAPIAMTSGSNAFYFLYQAIGIAQAKLATVSVSTTGLDVASGSAWTTPAAHAELATAIARAQGVLDSGADADLMDYQTYLLYLTLHGTADDIGAMFEGFNQVGFDNQVKTAPAQQAQTLTVSTAAKAVKSARHKKRVTSKVAVAGAKTSVVYRRLSGSKKLSIAARTGRIRVKKGTRKGTYTITLAVTAPAGTIDGIAYGAATRTVTVTVKVRR
jgi:hypothetical protein